MGGGAGKGNTPNSSSICIGTCVGILIVLGRAILFGFHYHSVPKFDSRSADKWDFGCIPIVIIVIIINVDSLTFQGGVLFEKGMKDSLFAGCFFVANEVSMKGIVIGILVTQMSLDAA